jgi:hypothetical protein
MPTDDAAPKNGDRPLTVDEFKTYWKSDIKPMLDTVTAHNKILIGEPEKNIPGLVDRVRWVERHRNWILCTLTGVLTAIGVSMIILLSQTVMKIGALP